MRESWCTRLVRPGRARQHHHQRATPTVVAQKHHRDGGFFFFKAESARSTHFSTRDFQNLCRVGRKETYRVRLRERRAFACALETYVSARVPLERLEVAQ